MRPHREDEDDTQRDAEDTESTQKENSCVWPFSVSSVFSISYVLDALPLRSAEVARRPAPSKRARLIFYRPFRTALGNNGPFAKFPAKTFQPITKALSMTTTAAQDFFRRRHRQHEWMDSPDRDPAELDRALAFIRRVNRCSGYNRQTLPSRCIQPELEARRSEQIT